MGSFLLAHLGSRSLYKALFIYLIVQHMHLAMAIWAQCNRVCDGVFTTLSEPSNVKTCGGEVRGLRPISDINLAAQATEIAQ